MHGASRGIQLGMEVPHRFLHFIYYRRYQLPIRIRIRSLSLYGRGSGLPRVSQNRTLEEIETMYILGVNPIKSKHWQPPEGEDLPSLDNTHLTPGARGIKKNKAGVPTEERRKGTGPQSGGIFQASGV